MRGSYTNVEVEQQVGRRSTLSAGYEYVRGANLLMSVNQNVPTCVASGTNNGCRPNSNYVNNSQYSSAPSMYPVLAVTDNGLVAAWTGGVPGATIIELRILPDDR